MTQALLDAIKFKDGLVPAVIVQEGGPVITLCYMDREALLKTLETGLVHVFRRSRGRVMLKGETSGHTQELRELRVDCEGNSLVLTVRQKVAGCHAGYVTCYYRRYDAARDTWEVCEQKVFDPGKVYGA